MIPKSDAGSLSFEFCVTAWVTLLLSELRVKENGLSIKYVKANATRESNEAKNKTNIKKRFMYFMLLYPYWSP